jgi:hypothetical protein
LLLFLRTGRLRLCLRLLHTLGLRLSLLSRWLRSLNLWLRPLDLRLRPLDLRLRPLDLRLRPLDLRLRPLCRWRHYSRLCLRPVLRLLAAHLHRCL